MNSLYKLGITEKEFVSIADEVSHNERTGLSIKAVKNGRVMCVSHDEKHNIIIKDIKRFGNFEIKPNTRILLKTLINFDNLPEQIYTLHSIACYRALDTGIKRVANKLEELKEKIYDRFSDKYDKTLAEKTYWNEFAGFDYDKRDKAKKQRKELIIKQLKAIYWLFDEPFDFQFRETKTNIATIVKVFSSKNIRLAVIQECEEFTKKCGLNKIYWETCNGIKLKIQAYKPNDRRYNYVCEGREIYTEFEDKQIWVCDELLGKISESEFKLLSNRLDDGYYQILTKERYEMEKDSLRVEIMTARRRELEEKSRKKLANKIRKQFKGGRVCRQGITITPDSISYNGITIKGDYVRDYLEFENLPLRETLDFQNICAGYIDYLLKKEKDYNNGKISVNFQGKAKFSLGSINITLEKQEHNKCFFINDFKVRKDELNEVILRALSFSDKKQYAEWLREVSRESLRLRNALKDGITFKFVVDKSDDNSLIQRSGEFIFTLSLKKENRKVYVRIGEKDYQIQDVNALFDLQKSVDTSRTRDDSLLARSIKLLYRGIKNISPKEIGEIIIKAQIDYNNKLARSEEFLDNAIRLTKALEDRDGWIVKGESGAEYLVEKDLSVHKMKDGEKDTYLCIMDSGEIDEDNKPILNDRIAKRLLGLRHDTTIADDMWNLGDKVDKWWQDIGQQEQETEMKEAIEVMVR